jgi:hypothetical protein
VIDSERCSVPATTNLTRLPVNYLARLLARALGERVKRFGVVPGANSPSFSRYSSMTA